MCLLTNLNMCGNRKHISLCRKQLWGIRVQADHTNDSRDARVAPPHPYVCTPCAEPRSPAPCFGPSLAQRRTQAAEDGSGSLAAGRLLQAPAGSGEGMLQAGSGTSRGTGSTASRRSPSCPKPAVSVLAFISHSNTLAFFILLWI